MHVCMLSTTVCRFDKMHALLAQHCCRPLRWTTNLCIVPNMKYNIHMTILRDDTSSSIALFNSTLVDDVTYSPPYLATCNPFSTYSFSTIKNRTLELVTSTYAMVSLANAYGCLRTSNMITHSSICAGDMWTSRVGTLHDFATLCCDLSKDMLCISTSRLSSWIFVSTWLIRTCSAFGSGQAHGVTSQLWGMRSISWSNSGCTLSVSICSSICSIS